MPPSDPPDEHSTLVFAASTGPRYDSFSDSNHEPLESEHDSDHEPDDPYNDSPRADSHPPHDRPPDTKTTTHYFEDPVHVQRLFSPERVELLQSVMAEPPESIRALARRLGRNPGDVNRDVHALAEYDVLTLEADDQAKRPVVPYDRVRVEVVLTEPGGNPDTADE